MRDEILDEILFLDLDQARQIIADRRLQHDEAAFFARYITPASYAINSPQPAIALRYMTAPRAGRLLIRRSPLDERPMAGHAQYHSGVR